MKRVAIVGFGAIGRSIAARMTGSGTSAAELVAVGIRAHQVEEARRILPAGIFATSRPDDLLSTEPDIVVEAAGHQAVAAYGPLVLAEGRDLLILSTGALADDTIRQRLVAAAEQGSGKIGVPAGAMAGFDGLLSLREAGLTSVTYRATKPPVAWQGTPAEQLCNLAELRQPLVVFKGSAREAALRFPKNANLAVAVAIAGIGLEKTQVELVADPGTDVNTGLLVAHGASSVLTVELINSSFESNPKTSEITGLSVVAALTNQSAVISYW